MSSLKQKDQGLEKEGKLAHYRFVYPKVKIAAPQISLSHRLDLCNPAVALCI